MIFFISSILKQISLIIRQLNIKYAILLEVSLEIHLEILLLCFNS
jgi:hypothetical protein